MKEKTATDTHRVNNWADSEGYRALAMLRSLKQSLEEWEFHNRV